MASPILFSGGTSIEVHLRQFALIQSETLMCLCHNVKDVIQFCSTKIGPLHGLAQNLCGWVRSKVEKRIIKMCLFIVFINVPELFISRLSPIKMRSIYTDVKYINTQPHLSWLSTFSDWLLSFQWNSRSCIVWLHSTCDIYIHVHTWVQLLHSWCFVVYLCEAWCSVLSTFVKTVHQIGKGCCLMVQSYTDCVVILFAPDLIW